MKRLLTAALITTLTACGAEDARDTAIGSPEEVSTAAAALTPALPAPTGVCPEFNDGYATFSPAGMKSRRVRLWMSAAARTMDGPLIFYWHGTGGSPEQAVGNSDSTGGFGPYQLEQIEGQGGIIAAPEHDPDAGQWPWFFVSGTSRNDDLRLADEVVACAIKKIGINTNRIHSVGFSAGALHTTEMSTRRANYLASVVTYSGGIMGGRTLYNPTPDNKFAALIFHGGSNDYVGMSFQDASQAYSQYLKSQGHFALLCNHNAGHSIPFGHPGVWRFIQDHPFGVIQTYPNGFPSEIPSYCVRN